MAPKSTRVRLSSHQSEQLKAAFEHSESPGSMELDEICKQTGLTGKWVRGWFCRQRKAKKAKEIKQRPIYASSAQTTSTAPTAASVGSTVSKDKETRKRDKGNSMASSAAATNNSAVKVGHPASVVRPTPYYGRVWMDYDTAAFESQVSATASYSQAGYPISSPLYVSTQFPLKQRERYTAKAQSARSGPAGPSSSARGPGKSTPTAVPGFVVSGPLYAPTQRHSPMVRSVPLSTTPAGVAAHMGNMPSFSAQVPMHERGHAQSGTSLADDRSNGAGLVARVSASLKETHIEYSSLAGQNNLQQYPQSVHPQIYSNEQPVQSAGYLSPIGGGTGTMTTGAAACLGSPFKGVVSVSSAASGIDNLSLSADGQPGHPSPRFLQQVFDTPSYGTNNDDVAMKFVQAQEVFDDECMLQVVPRNDTDVVDLVLHSLDPNLAERDPFQAALGLVFLSNLGLKWDHC